MIDSNYRLEVLINWFMTTIPKAGVVAGGGICSLK